MPLAAPGKAGVGTGTYLMAEPLTLVLKWHPRQRYSSRWLWELLHWRQDIGHRDTARRKEVKESHSGPLLSEVKFMWGETGGRETNEKARELRTPSWMEVGISQWGQMPEISGKRAVRVGQGGGGSEPNGQVRGWQWLAEKDGSIACFFKLRFLWTLYSDMLDQSYGIYMTEAQSNDLRRNVIMTVWVRHSLPLTVSFVNRRILLVTGSWLSFWRDFPSPRRQMA